MYILYLHLGKYNSAQFSPQLVHKTSGLLASILGLWRNGVREYSHGSACVRRTTLNLHPHHDNSCAFLQVSHRPGAKAVEVSLEATGTFRGQQRTSSAFQRTWPPCQVSCQPSSVSGPLQFGVMSILFIDRDTGIQLSVHRHEYLGLAYQLDS